MSFYTMAFMGMMPFGSLMAGGLANSIGVPRTVMIGGALCMICAGWFATQLKEIRRQIRPMYVDLGILPEVATGIQTASMLQTHRSSAMPAR